VSLGPLSCIMHELCMELEETSQMAFQSRLCGSLPVLSTVTRIAAFTITHIAFLGPSHDYIINMWHTGYYLCVGVWGTGRGVCVWGGGVMVHAQHVCCLCTHVSGGMGALQHPGHGVASFSWTCEHARLRQDPTRPGGGEVPRQLQHGWS
jgi:hypothetical protein